MKYAVLGLALAVGLLVGAAGHGSGPALIDTLDGGARLLVLLVLGVVLYGALWNAGRAVGRYHKAGDPIQVHSIDQATGEPIVDAPKTAREARHDGPTAAR